MTSVVNIVIAGLGGQGALMASDIVAEAAFRAGLDVKKSEVHGMSQRGGSVTSDVRFGAQVLSPMVPEREADFLVALDASQVDTNRARLARGGTLIAPDAVDAERLENRRTLNVALLGALSRRLDIPEACWREALSANLPAKVLDVNLRAFETGRTT